MSFVSFVKKHYAPIVIISIAVVSFSIAGISMLTSKLNYDAYLRKYEHDAEEIKASFPALPKEVMFNNDYIAYSSDGNSVASSESEYSDFKILRARDASVAPLSTSKAQEYKTIDGDNSSLREYITGLDRMGGAITFTINTATYGMSDIVIHMRTNYVDGSNVYHALDNLSDYIKIQVNKLELKTTNLTLSNERNGFQTLVFKDTFLIRGENTITFTTSAYNSFDNKDSVLYVMPDIRNLTVLTDVELAD